MESLNTNITSYFQGNALFASRSVMHYWLTVNDFKRSAYVAANRRSIFCCLPFTVLTPSFSTDMLTQLKICLKTLLLSDLHKNISIVKSSSCTNVPNLFYFGMTLYMFRTVFPSIMRSKGLYIQQQTFVKQIR